MQVGEGKALLLISCIFYLRLQESNEGCVWRSYSAFFSSTVPNMHSIQRSTKKMRYPIPDILKGTESCRATCRPKDDDDDDDDEDDDGKEGEDEEKKVSTTIKVTKRRSCLCFSHC